MRTIKLESSDGMMFDVDEDVAITSDLIKAAIGCDSDNSTPLQLAKVNGGILAMAIEWAKAHKNDEYVLDTAADLPLADRRFFTAIGKPNTYQLVVAANYLCMDNLFNAGCKYLADLIKGKTTSQIRRIFNIPSDSQSLLDEEEEVC